MIDYIIWGSSRLCLSSRGQHTLTVYHVYCLSGTLLCITTVGTQDLRYISFIRIVYITYV